MRLLVVEDDRHLREAIVDVLEDEGYETDSEGNGADGLQQAQAEIYDLIILDIMLPGMDGISLLRSLRKGGNVSPVIFLTAMDEVASRISGLDAGGDDYLVKPFAVGELLARVRALLRRSKGINPEGELVCGEVVVPIQEHEAYCKGQPLHLTVKEYELLRYLIENQGRILQREQLYVRVWGLDSDASESSVDLYVHYLRKKLAPYGCDGYIRTIRGVGYKVSAEHVDV
ncbi:response regulator transcription factor [Paenibacillus sp. HB172176]|uniref:response regulator transcription factor n=1 Tax=Paenibacillus sp. HB172176 TaxID=2493690 RepID=UPI0014388706|nr:response regulator transcription factor [Paenibacillus sp. HB172176]